MGGAQLWEDQLSSGGSVARLHSETVIFNEPEDSAGPGAGRRLVDRRQAGLSLVGLPVRDDEQKPYLLQLQLALALPCDAALF